MHRSVAHGGDGCRQDVVVIGTAHGCRERVAQLVHEGHGAAKVGRVVQRQPSVSVRERGDARLGAPAQSLRRSFCDDNAKMRKCSLAKMRKRLGFESDVM